MLTSKIGRSLTWFFFLFGMLECVTIVVMLGTLIVTVLNLSTLIVGEEEEVQEVLLEALEVVLQKWLHR
jgi:hypothetical protein